MKLISILAIIGVIIVVVAIGYGINHNLTGFAVSGGADAGNEDTGSSNSDDNSGNIDNIDNTTEIIVNSTEDETEEKSSGGGGGGGGSSTPVIPEEVCDFVDNDLDGEVDEGCANIYGTIYDTDNDTPLEGINISFYDYDTYSFDDYGNSSGDYELLLAKETPDAVTDENGSYNVSLPEGVYNMVLQGSDEKDFEIHADASKGALKHDVELNENESLVSDTFNAEGHILFSGKYEQNNGNKYVCGDKLKFMMFGVNNGELNQTITFMIEDHNMSPGVNGALAYLGDISLENESLFIPAGNKTDKIFEFEIPCSYKLGKHDIHVIWNDSKWHKIGNFFIIEDTTNPGINADDLADGLPGENITINYNVWNYAQPGTVGEQEISISEGANSTLVILIDKDNDGIHENSFEVGDSTSINVSYESNGSYTLNLTVRDRTGNENSVQVDITIYINETQADEISKQAYSEMIPELSVDSWTGDISGVYRTWDRYDSSYLIGDEYLTEGDISDGDKNTINNFVCTQYPYFIIIDPTTAEAYDNTIRSFLNDILAC